MSHQFWRALCFPSSPRPLCRWPGKEGLIKQGVKPGNATNIYNAHILATWTAYQKPQPLHSFTMILLQKAWHYIQSNNHCNHLPWALCRWLGKEEIC
jgi:hypothetical protein